MAAIFCQTEERKDDVRLFSPKCNRSSLHVRSRRSVPPNHNAKFECFAKSRDETLHGVFSTSKTPNYMIYVGCPPFFQNMCSSCYVRLEAALVLVHAKYKYLLSCDILYSYKSHALLFSKTDTCPSHVWCRFSFSKIQYPQWYVSWSPSRLFQIKK
jgi:hypothetical protein